MYRTIKDFAENWDRESQATIIVFNNLTDDSLSQKVTEEGRSLGIIAWHTTQTLSELTEHAKIPIDSTADKEEIPDNIADIVSIYERDSKAVGEIVKASWADEQLDDEIEMYGQKMKKGFVLAVLIAHQTHHRGQITVLMRQAGLRVPGIYGPAKEDWKELGMPAVA